MATGACSECGKPLHNPAAKTCGATCRSARSRRLKRKIKEQAARANDAQDYHDEEHRRLAHAAHDREPEALRAVVREEMRPVVREAITEDTYRALRDLVALTPRAVECIAEDLYGDDAMIRQRAYTLLAKYTIGHQAIVRPEETEHGGQMIVNFNLPRPGDVAEGVDAAVALESVELRTCDMCGTDKPITEFVANSQRCVECYEKQRDLARQLMAES